MHIIIFVATNYNIDATEMMGWKEKHETHNPYKVIQIKLQYYAMHTDKLKEQTRENGYPMAIRPHLPYSA